MMVLVVALSVGLLVPCTIFKATADGIGIGATH